MARVAGVARTDVPEWVAGLRLQTDATLDLGAGVAVRAHRSAPNEIWVAVPIRTESGLEPNERVRALLFVIFEQAIQPVGFEPRPDWPSGPLARY